MKGKNLHCVCSVQLNPPVNSSKFMVKACLLFMIECTKILLHTVKPKIKVFFFKLHQLQSVFTNRTVRHGDKLLNMLS